MCFNTFWIDCEIVLNRHRFKFLNENGMSITIHKQSKVNTFTTQQRHNNKIRSEQ
ncbi:conserved hypothetical protein [Staphylococcus aureus]|nr:hypothetical protein HMPREF9528_01375 [Staphylococcus aureus subsp. aureus MRSA131]CRI15343.1 conserved hypothetical protein [Staphylococcus aureus]CRI16607.1 conserved hypothetical protein [Staphylococcus aureus]CRI18543.1 conserved hypothetical protein [Staphylococcus aureus]CRI28363.1 conserved hypothetical protein [Staphylococcus aureus]